MLKEYDLVKANKDISTLVRKDCNGTIVMVYSNPSIAYEVEFFNIDNKTIEVLTVEETDIELRNQ